MVSAPSKKFRVLVVDDSAFMRKVLETIFNADEQLTVIGHAKDGREAIALAESLKPDVITMDLNMPHLDGLQATAQIMTTNPRPIVVVSSESKEGAASTLRALELGAIDFVTKPSSGIDLDMQSVKDDLLRKVRIAAKVRVVRTASRLAAALQAPMNGNACSSTVYSRGISLGYAISRGGFGGFDGRSGDGDAVGSGIHERFSGCGDSGAAHAGGVHHAICAAACGVHGRSRERGGSE